VSWTVYILRTASGRLYTGITTDLARRVAEHRGERRNGAKSLKGDPPQSVAWSEPAADRAAATRREAQIKRLSRAAKLALVDAGPRGRRVGRHPARG
jgi:putative endonuclease